MTPDTIDRQDDIDLTIIEHNLSLSYEQRIEQHDGALQLFLDLVKAREVLYPELKQTS